MATYRGKDPFADLSARAKKILTTDSDSERVAEEPRLRVYLLTRRASR